jgi:hypothetical protein
LSFSPRIARTTSSKDDGNGHAGEILAGHRNRTRFPRLISEELSNKKWQSIDASSLKLMIINPAGRTGGAPTLLLRQEIRSLMTQKMDENWHTLCPALGSAGPGQQICKVSARKPSIKNNESGFTNNWCFLRQRHLLNHKAQLHTNNYHLPPVLVVHSPECHLAPDSGNPKYTAQTVGR